MKRLLMQPMVVILMMTGISLLACASDFEISVERKREGPGRMDGDVMQSASQTWAGEGKVVNRSFKASPELEARYIVFVRRQELGQKAGGDRIEQVKGSAKVEALKPGDIANFAISEVKLRQQRLEPGYYYASGGLKKADDNIAGVWLKLFNGTTEVGEYVSTPLVKTKFKWE